MDRTALIRAIDTEIGDRPLVWFGTRGSDAAPLRCLKRFEGVFSIIARLGNPSWRDDQEVCLEDLTGRRVDLNAYTIDDDLSDEAAVLHEAMMGAIGDGALVAAYRSCHFLSAASLARSGHDSLLSMVYGIQSAFDNKPWVETSLTAAGVNTIPWRYYSRLDWGKIHERLHTEPVVLRLSYSDGGNGLRLVSDPKDLGDEPPRSKDRLIAAAQHLHPNIPLNVSGCVWPRGEVTLHAPSVQLVGHAECTGNPFAYCGNDFGALSAHLDDDRIREFERMTLLAGRWLASQGYRGAFGVDALLFRDRVYLTEVNPRFQGCSAVGAAVSRSLGLPDIYLDHLASYLEIPMAGERPGLVEQAHAQAERPLAQVAVYAKDGAMMLRDGAIAPDAARMRLRGVPTRARTVVERDAMLYKLVVEGTALAGDGASPALDPTVSGAVARYREALFEPVAPA